MRHDSKIGSAKMVAAGSVGLREVAKLAGVSTATVSRAMNKPDIVSSELRDRVSRAVDALGWVPDGAARALTTRRSGAIGAVFPTLSHGDFARAAEALESELALHGYTLLLACSRYDPEQEYRLVRKFVERGVDALALVGLTHKPELIDLLQRRNMPFVNTFSYDTGHQTDCIGPDNRKAMWRLTRHLISQGHRRFGVIAQSIQNNDRASARLQGINDALAEAGLKIKPEHLVYGQWTIAQGRALFRDIVAHRPWPTAVICGNAYLAVGAELEALGQGIALPKQMSIVGYDDIEIMQELPVPITTLRVRSDEVGRRAASYLVAAIDGHTGSIPMECEVEIVERASSGPVTTKRSGSRRTAPDP